MLETIYRAILAGELDAAREATTRALGGGESAKRILDEGLIAPMDIVGREFEDGVRYIPEMLISAEAMKAALEVLRPHLAAGGIPARGRVVIGTVEGDLHDIGKDLVATMLEGAGFEVIDLGVEVTADRFLRAVEEDKPDVLAMSALLTTTMVFMPAVIDHLREAGARDAVKIIIGGAPVTEAFAQQIGADAYADDAAAAVKVVKQLIASGG